jgi:hypothetical protein
MLLHDDGLPGSRFYPLHRERPHGGQRRAPHRPEKAPGAPGCGRVARCAPCHGLGRTWQPSARHPAPPTPLYPSGEKTQAPRASTHGRDAPWQHGGPWPRVTALRGTMPWHVVYKGTWGPREESACLQGERHATGRSARGRGARSGVSSDRDVSCHGHGVLAPRDRGGASAGGRMMTMRESLLVSSA